MEVTAIDKSVKDSPSNQIRRSDNPAIQDFVRVSSAFFHDDSSYNFDLYLLKKGQFQLCRRRGLGLNEPGMPTLSGIGKMPLVIKKTDNLAFLRYIESTLPDSLIKNDLPFEECARLLCEIAQIVMGDLLADLKRSESYRRVEKLAETIVSFIYHDPKSIPILMSQDLTGSFEVIQGIRSSIISIGICRKMALADDQVLAIGLANLLKDIGLQRISKAIVNKTNGLIKSEMEIISKHPMVAIGLIENALELSKTTTEAILNHHELLDGSGYPKGLKGNQIPLACRITTVAHIFNSLTLTNAQGEAWDLYKALNHMKSKMAHKIDPEIFRQLILSLRG